MGVPRRAASTVTVPLAANAKSACAIASQLSPSMARRGDPPSAARKKAAPAVGDAGKTQLNDFARSIRSTASSNAGK